jgi:hemerythrin-like metal-binding protein
MTSGWTPEATTNIPEIDAQHDELFHAVAAFSAEIECGRGRQAVGKMLEFLTEFAVRHFATEERLMAAVEFPGLVAHRAAHDEFIVELACWRERFADGDGAPSVLLPLDLQFRLAMWLRDHISDLDCVFGRFVAAEPADASREPPGTLPSSLR